MRKKFVEILAFFLFSSILAGTHFSARAQDNSSWLADKIRLKNLSAEIVDGDSRCQSTWNILWPRVRTGEPEAKALLVSMLLPWPHGDSIRMPARTTSDSNNSNIRDGIIMIAHTIGDSLSDQIESGSAYSTKEAFYGRALIFLTDKAFEKAFPDMESKDLKGERFLRCIAFKSILNQPMKDCVDSAIEQGVIPSFDLYVHEIDQLLNEGHKPKCSFAAIER